MSSPRSPSARGGPEVLAVVVCHASRTRLRDTLRSLGEQTYPSLSIVIGAVGELELPDDADLPPSAVVRVSEEAGFAEAVAAAVREAPDVGYVLLCHDDVSLEPDAVAELVRTAESDPSIAAVGSKLVEWYQPNVLQEVGAAIDRYAIRRSALDAGEVDAGQRDDTADVLFCSDACLLVRREALDEVGGLDHGAWPFYEDVDLCWRLRVRGYRVVVATAARVRHAADLSHGRRLFDVIALREHAERGRLRFMLKHYAPLGIAVLVPQIVVASLARLVAALVRRELWRVRVIFNSWRRVAVELPSLLQARRNAGPRKVDDRELLSLAGRGAAAGVRGERAEWASRLLGNLGRIGDGFLALARRPVSWAWVVATIVLVVLLRDVLFSGTFAMGEVRPIPTLGDAITDHLGRVRREGLDPFGQPTPGLLALALLRSLARSAALAEKLLLGIPVWLAGASGGRLGRTLGLGREGRGWLAVVSAVNPVTLSLLRDGAVGGLTVWAASLWVVAALLAPAPVGEGIPARVRFIARWSVGWAVAVALHPPTLLWLGAIGAVIVAVRRNDGRTGERLHILLSGAAGAFVLLLPWSLEWFTTRSALVARPGWLVPDTIHGLTRASLGAGWPLLAWLALAVGAAFFVGQTSTTFGLTALSVVAVLAASTGAFPRETMLAGAGVCALLILGIVARRVIDDLPRYELGVRHAAVIGGLATLGVLWLGGVVFNAAAGARVRDLPVVSTERLDTGRVLWLAETVGGLRSWTTLSFAERLGAFPPPAGPAEHLAANAVEAAREGRTHRMGGIVALADVSHIVALDPEAQRGLGSQTDLAPLELQRTSVVYRNDAWQGPAIGFSAPPDNPLSPDGLAAVVRNPRPIEIHGWPYGPMSMRVPPQAGPRGAVVYLASGPRGGLRISGAAARVTAAGAYVPARAVEGTVRVGVPGRLWRWMLPLELILIVVLLGAWVASAYMGGPAPPASELLPDMAATAVPAWQLAAIGAAALLGVGLGWSGLAWGVGGPFLSSAWYCAPIGSGFGQAIAIVNPNSDGVEYLVRSHLSAPPVASGRLAAASRESLVISPTKGAVVESYGRRLAVATQVSRQGRRDASLCANSTHEMNVFPEGGRAATRARPRLFERYILYNPFSDIARASVKFVSNEETLAPPRLQDVQVKPGSFTLVDPEQEFEPMLDLSTVVRVWQGRAIVARRLRTVEQVSWSLPVEPRQFGVLPRAETEAAQTDIIAANVSDEPARVSIFGAGRRGSIRERDLPVPPGGRSTFNLNDVAPRAAELVVEVEADRPVALESLVAPDDRRDVSLLPLLDPERRWVFPMAERRELLVVNPNPRAVRVEIERLGGTRSKREVTIQPSRAARLPLRARGGFGLIVRSRGGDVTAAVVGPEGSMPGVPLP